MKQEYARYTAADFEVWQTLFNRQIENLQGKAYPDYLQGIERVGFRSDTIPDFAAVNATLAKLTGWQLEVVPGIVPPAHFFGLLAQRRFPASTWLRKPHQLDYLEEPDMFHDVFGHVPLLAIPKYCQFFVDMANIALRYDMHPVATEMLNRLYWFTVEFGLVEQAQKLQVYGAGILSSYGETNFALSTEPVHKPFNLREVVTTWFDNSKIQNTYYVVNSLNEVYDCIPELTALIEEALRNEIVKLD